MAICQELSNQIRRMYYVEHFTVNAICENLKLHKDTVKRAVNRPEVKRKSSEIRYSNLVMPYQEIILEKLKKYPKMSAVRIFKIIKDYGYKGGISTLRSHLRVVRKSLNPQSFIKMKVYPGEQSQVDWAHFGTMTIGNAQRKLYLFTMVLSWSRLAFSRFVLHQETSTFLSLHEEAFEYFNGIPKIILYDNLKSAVIARRGNDIRYNSQLLDFSGFYNYEPRACAPYSGNQKGRVERFFRYARENFFYGLEFNGLADLNSKLLKWLEYTANVRPWPDNNSYSVKEKAQEEQSKLLEISERRVTPKQIVTVCAKKQPYVRFDLNEYSIPHNLIKKNLTLSADTISIEIYDGNELISLHDRSWDKGQIIEDSDHIKKMLEERKGRSLPIFRSQLEHKFENLHEFLNKSFSLGNETSSNLRKIGKLTEQYCDEIIQYALEKCIQEKRYTAESLRHFAHQIEKQLNMRPVTHVDLSHNPSLSAFEIKSHNPAIYDQLGGE